MQEIGSLLNSRSAKSTSILTNRLKLLNLDIEKLRQQQQTIVQIIGQSSQLRSTRVMDKERWVKLLSATGLNEDNMLRWHIKFEQAMPEMHQDFLESLGISKKEIKGIREWSKKSVI